MKIGGDSPISVQTMTNTLTSDAKSTIEQIERVTNVGADLVRVSVPDKDSSEALKDICKNVNIPVIASGGISCIDDIYKISPYVNTGISGIIIGRALYENKISIQEAKKIFQN